MSREPFVPSHNDAGSALSDVELDGVVGGNNVPRCPRHPSEPIGHVVDGPRGTSVRCYG
jgi:hypothetical protein